MTRAEFDKCQTCGHMRPDHDDPRDYGNVDAADAPETAVCLIENCSCTDFVLDSDDLAKRMQAGNP